MKLKMHRSFSTSLIGLLLSSCATGTGDYYSPQVRDVSEEVIDGNYWYQKFTLYDPANSATDCPISRTGQKNWILIHLRSWPKSGATTVAVPRTTTFRDPAACKALRHSRKSRS